MSSSGGRKALTSHLFTPLFMFIHLPLILFAPPPHWLIDFKNSKWLTYFCILLCICYCFSHLIALLAVTWSSLLYKFTRFLIDFLFLSDEGPMLETLDYTIRIGSTPTFLYFDLYLYSAYGYAAHYVYWKYFAVLPKLWDRIYHCGIYDVRLSNSADLFL